MIEKEIWEKVCGYEGIYEVSTLGRIKSLKRGKTKMLTSKDQILLSKNGKKKTSRVGSLVAQAFLNHTPSMSGMQVTHIDGDATNNKLGNLILVSKRETTSRNRARKGKYKGVQYSSYYGMYVATISVNGAPLLLGYFNKEIDAGMAYMKAAEKYD